MSGTRPGVDLICLYPRSSAEFAADRKTGVGFEDRHRNSKEPRHCRDSVQPDLSGVIEGETMIVRSTLDDHL